MIKICSHKYLLTLLLLAVPSTMVAAEKKTGKDTVPVYKLEYLDREQGVDEYETIMLVSDRFIRIDQPGEDEGYIVYDDSNKVIYSVSHVDRSVLVINQYEFSEADAPVKRKVEYLPLSDAPEISGHTVFNYRVYAKDDDEETCTEVQLAENLLPDVTKILKNYHRVVSGQQVKLTDNNVNEIQTPCYYIDQIYNTAEYYDKGLPIQEWHSNERSRILTSYNESSVSRKKFDVPEDYRHFSIDKNSKTFID